MTNGEASGEDAASGELARASDAAIHQLVDSRIEGALTKPAFGAVMKTLGAEKKRGAGGRHVYRGLCLRGSVPMLAVVGGSEAML